MNKDYIGSLLIEKGEKFYTLGKMGIISLLSGLGLAAFICILGLLLYGRIYFLEGYGITIFDSIISILLTIIGGFLLPFFFFGLHYMGLGKICENTKLS